MDYFLGLRTFKSSFMFALLAAFAVAPAAMAASDCKELMRKLEADPKSLTEQERRDVSYCEGVELAVGGERAAGSLSLQSRNQLLAGMKSGDITSFVKQSLAQAAQSARRIGMCTTAQREVKACLANKTPDMFFAREGGSGSCVNGELVKAKRAADNAFNAAWDKDQDQALDSTKAARDRMDAASLALNSMGNIYTRLTNVREISRLCAQGKLSGWTDANLNEILSYKGPCPDAKAFGEGVQQIIDALQSPSNPSACLSDAKEAVLGSKNQARKLLQKVKDRAGGPSYAEEGLRFASSKNAGDRLSEFQGKDRGKSGGGETAGLTFKAGPQSDDGGRFDKVSKADRDQIDLWVKEFGSDSLKYKSKMFELADQAGKRDVSYSRPLNPRIRERIFVDCGRASQGDGVGQLFCARSTAASYLGRLKELKETLDKTGKTDERNKLLLADPLLEGLAQVECGSTGPACRETALNNAVASVPGAIGVMNASVRDGMLASMLGARCQKETGASCLNGKEIDAINTAMVPPRWIYASQEYKPVKPDVTPNPVFRKIIGVKSDKDVICSLIPDEAKRKECEAAQKNPKASPGDPQRGRLQNGQKLSGNGANPDSTSEKSNDEPGRKGGKGNDQVDNYFPNPWSAGFLPFPKGLCKATKYGFVTMTLPLAPLTGAAAFSIDCENAQSETKKEDWHPPECQAVQNCNESQKAADPALSAAIQTSIGAMHGRELDVRLRMEATATALSQMAKEYYMLVSHSKVPELGDLKCSVPDGPQDVSLGKRYKDFGLEKVLFDSYEAALRSAKEKPQAEETRATLEPQDIAKYQQSMVEAASIIRSYDEQIAAIAKDLGEKPELLENQWFSSMIPCQTIVKVFDGAKETLSENTTHLSENTPHAPRCNGLDMVAHWAVSKNRDRNGKSQEACEVEDSDTPADEVVKNYLERMLSEDMKSLSDEQAALVAAQNQERQDIAAGASEAKAGRLQKGAKALPPGSKEQPTASYAPIENPGISAPTSRNLYAPLLRKRCDASGQNCTYAPCRQDACTVKRSVMESLMSKRAGLLARFRELRQKVNPKLFPDQEDGEPFYKKLRMGHSPDDMAANQKMLSRLSDVNQASATELREAIAELCRHPESAGAKLLADKNQQKMIMGCSETPLIPPGATQSEATAAINAAERCRFMHANSPRLCEMEKWQEKASAIKVGDGGGIGGSEKLATTKLEQNNEAINGTYGAVMDAQACLGLAEGLAALPYAFKSATLSSLPRFLARAAVAAGKHLIKGTFSFDNAMFMGAATQGKIVAAGIGGGLNNVALQKGFCAAGVISEEECVAIQKQDGTGSALLWSEVKNAIKGGLAFAALGGVGETVHEAAVSRTKSLVEKYNKAESELNEAMESKDRRRIEQATANYKEARKALVANMHGVLAADLGLSAKKVEKMGFPPDEVVDMAKEAVAQEKAAKDASIEAKKIALQNKRARALVKAFLDPAVRRLLKRATGKLIPASESPFETAKRMIEAYADLKKREANAETKKEKQELARLRAELDHALDLALGLGPVDRARLSRAEKLARLEKEANPHLGASSHDVPQNPSPFRDSPKTADYSIHGKDVTVDGHSWVLRRDPAEYRDRYSGLFEKYPDHKENPLILALLDTLELEHANEPDEAKRRGKIEEEVERILKHLEESRRQRCGM